MTSASLPHLLDRTIVIRATPDIVFEFFTESSRWASWWGAGSTIDPRVGGAMLIRNPDGSEVVGELLDIQAPKRIAFTYGYTSGTLVAPGGSRVTIQLEPCDGGTKLSLRHEFSDAAVRDQHIQGWRYQLSLFANVVSDYANRGAAELADAWFDLWANPDAAERERIIARIATSDLRFHDRYGNTEGAADLLPHIAAAQHYMPGFRMQRSGDVRHCQGTALVDWTAPGPGGVDLRGTNVFTLDANGRIESVTGFMSM